MGGWVAGDVKNIAISSFNLVEVEVEDELGNWQNGMKNMKERGWNVKFEIWNIKCQIWNIKYKVWNMK